MKTIARIPRKLWVEFALNCALSIGILILCHLLK